MSRESAVFLSYFLHNLFDLFSQPERQRAPGIHQNGVFPRSVEKIRDTGANGCGTRHPVAIPHLIASVKKIGVFCQQPAPYSLFKSF
jgi:hypothetical protein